MSGLDRWRRRVVVVDDDLEAGPLEQAASAAAQAGRIIRRTDYVWQRTGHRASLRRRVHREMGARRSDKPSGGIRIPAPGRDLPYERHPNGRQNRGSVNDHDSKSVRGLRRRDRRFRRDFIALFSLVLLVPIILLVANRAEPDQRGQRSHSVYLFGMSFVALQLTFAGSVLIVTRSSR